MKRHLVLFTSVALVLCFAGAATRGRAQAAASAPLAVNTARIVLSGTSNIHAYTAESRAVRLVNVKVAGASTAASFWTDVVKPGELQTFDIAVRVDSLHSPKDGVDKNMHKALKAEQHPDITFRLSRIERSPTGATKAVGVLQVAGVLRELGLDLTLTRRDATLVVTGQTQLLMTDFGIAPPKAMLGMLKTDPKVAISFETVLSVPAL